MNVCVTDKKQWVVYIFFLKILCHSCFPYDIKSARCFVFFENNNNKLLDFNINIFAKNSSRCIAYRMHVPVINCYKEHTKTFFSDLLVVYICLIYFESLSQHIV